MMYMYAQTIVISHMTATDHNGIMVKMPDAIWSHLDTINELIVVKVFADSDLPHKNIIDVLTTIWTLEVKYPSIL